MPTTIALARPRQPLTVKKELKTGAILAGWAIALLLFSIVIAVRFPALAPDPFQMMAMF